MFDKLNDLLPSTIKCEVCNKSVEHDVRENKVLRSYKGRRDMIPMYEVRCTNCGSVLEMPAITALNEAIDDSFRRLSCGCATQEEINLLVRVFGSVRGAANACNINIGVMNEYYAGAIPTKEDSLVIRYILHDTAVEK